MRFRTTANLIGALVLAASASFADEPPVTVKPENEGEKSSEFLQPPSATADRYGPKVNWSDVPLWEQTSFFGLRARGKFFIYVVDCSGSMGEGDRLGRAKRELRRSVGGMRSPQRFQVIFYNDRPLVMPGGIPQAADAPGKSSFFNWVNLIEAEGATDPRGALSQALSLRPDGIFLLSDGEFPEGTADSIKKSNTRKVPIYCIDLSGGSTDQLRRIARDSGGQYTAQP